MSRCRPIVFVVLLAGLFLIPAAPAFGQGRRAMGLGHKKPARPDKPQRAQKPPTQHTAPLEQFQSMSPQQREQELAKLPADRRDKMQRQLQHYDQLTPAQREKLDWFNHLAPDRKDAFRKAFQKFQGQPPERQQAMREELRNLRTMSESERGTRIESPDFRGKFNENEKHILSEMAGTLPTQ